MQMNFKETLKTEFKNIGIILTERQAAQFEAFYNLLIEDNKKFNLTAITDMGGVIKKHFADSVLLLKEFDIKQGAFVLDVGCGAGLPGLPIKILRPDIKLTLIDSVNKKVEFVNKVIAVLRLENAQALHGRAEYFANSSPTDASGLQKLGGSRLSAACPAPDGNLGGIHSKVPLCGGVAGESPTGWSSPAVTRFLMREQFDYVLSRAVAPLNVLAEYCLPFVRLGGFMLAYKSVKTDEELQAAQTIINLLGGKPETVIKINVFDNGRSFVIIKKESPTPDIYPRKAKKIGKY